MSSNRSRIDLLVDVFTEKAQLARALPGVTPPELVESILQEFRTLEYLGDNPRDYRLLRAADQSPLDDDRPLDKQIAPKEQLVLAERPRELPPGAQALAGSVYLRDLTLGKVFRLGWQPAIIGRPDEKLPENHLLAVNLAGYSTGLRVSRRHARITEARGQYFIQSMSENPTLVQRGGGEGAAGEQVGQQPFPLRLGDVIWLERSRIRLKFGSY